MMELPPERVKCPYTAFKKSCCELAINCPKFIQLQGVDPQTGAQVDKWGCTDSFLPMLLIENAQMQRQTGAAVESFRNESVRRENATHDAIAALLLARAQLPPQPQMIEDAGGKESTD